jgi:dTMP kinase
VSRIKDGLFIVLEGIDGSGTTTQTRRLASALRERGHEVLTTRQPSDGPIGRTTRAALSADPAPPRDSLALLFAADRLAHLAAEIVPALERGAVVICDRYVMSSLAYQGLDCPLGWIETINARARGADVTVLVRVDPRVARHRVLGRIAAGGVEEIFDDDDLQRRLAEAYDRLAPQHGAQIVDGEAPIETITGRLLEICDEALAARRLA